MDKEDDGLSPQDRRNIFLLDFAKGLLASFIEEKNWVVGVLMAAELIESSGKARLKLELHKVISNKKIDGLSLDQVTMMLFASHLIDKVHYAKFHAVRERRNDFAHSLWGKVRSIGYTQGKPNPQAKRIIEDAIDCLEALFPSR